MTLLGGDLGGMDQAAERKASLSLEGNQLGLLGLGNPQVGQCVKVCAELCVESISNYPNEKGVPEMRVGFVVESIVREEEEPDPHATVQSMYPSMRGPGQ